MRRASDPTLRPGRWLLALALSVYLFTAGGSLTTTDAVVMFDLTRNMVEHHSVALSGNLLGMDAHRGADGRYYSPFGIAQSIYNVPFYVAGKAAMKAVPRIGKPDSVLKAVVALGQTFLVALLVWQIFHLSMFVATPAAALMAALTCAFGSLLWPYSSFGFNQPLAAVMLTAAVGAAARGMRDDRLAPFIWSGIWTGIGLLTRHEIALAAIPIGLWLMAASSGVRMSRFQRAIAFAPGVVAGVAAWAIYNAIRFGNPLDSGFLRDTVPGFGSPILDGVKGLLFSPSTSVFLYSPFVIFGIAGMALLWRRTPGFGALLTSLCLGALLFYATLGNWIGGRSYGSRYLFVVLPLVGVGWAVLLDSLQHGIRRTLFILVTTAGLIVQLPGVLVDYAKVSQTAAYDGTLADGARKWSWQASWLTLNTAALVRAVPDNMAYITGVRPRPSVPVTGSDDDRGFSQQFAFSLDLWWLYLFYLGAVSRAAMMALVATFITAMIVCARGLKRSARHLATST